MPSPFAIIFYSIECIATDDLIGMDNIFARFDDPAGLSIPLGSFAPGDISSDYPEHLIPSGAKFLFVYDDDFLSADDSIGAIDLELNIDVERDILLTSPSSSASYRFRFLVLSEPSG
jgi:hypothetical protein